MTLTAEQPYGRAAAEIIAERAAGVFVLPRREVLDIEEIEGVHAMRVATRRLRAALEVFQPCLPARRGRCVLGEVKELADALGERRDRDVQLELLTRLLAKTAGAERHAVELLAEELRSEQAEANVTLGKALHRAKRMHLSRRLADLAQRASS